MRHNHHGYLLATIGLLIFMVPARADEHSDGPTIQFYGLIKLDASYDSVNAKNGDYVLSVPSQGLLDSTHQPDLGDR